MTWGRSISSDTKGFSPAVHAAPGDQQQLGFPIAPLPHSASSQFHQHPCWLPSKSHRSLRSSRRRLPSESAAHSPTHPPSLQAVSQGGPSVPQRVASQQVLLASPAGGFRVPPAPQRAASLQHPASLASPWGQLAHGFHQHLPACWLQLAAPQATFHPWISHGCIHPRELCISLPDPQGPWGTLFPIGSFLRSSRAAPIPSCCVLSSCYP